MHRRRLLATVGASALLVLGSLPLPALAAGPDRVPRQLDMSNVDPVFRSPFADPDRRVTVILELAGRPALGVASTRAGQQAQAGRLRAAQRPLVTAVKAAGARVTGSYQYAYNGLRVVARVGDLARLAAIRGVAAVKPVPTYRIDNVNGAKAVGAPAAWGNDNATGAGTIVAVIDTGIDYTHANFGGSGDAADYTANDRDTIEPGTFPTAKVIAGRDFAGDDYDASSANPSLATPAPDDDPIDCNGHGSHVAGTVAGAGVRADHSTFAGRYQANTVDDAADWAVGPGVAPEAKLVALKVFGCDGSSDVVVEALEWVAEYNATHAVGIDVVNMSLGSPFGRNTDPDAVASNNLVGAGVVVVASAGNDNPVPYITGSPAAATRAISVAAIDANPTLPMAVIDNSGADIPGINQNAHPGLPVAGTLLVVPDDPATTGVNEFLGCPPAEAGGPSPYPAAAAGRIVAVKRGVCAFVEKGAAAEAAGAIGIIVINRDDTPPGALPTFLGYNPEIFDIPMIGTDRVAQAALVAVDGQPIELKSAGAQPNPAHNAVTGFSSSGPRWGDSWLKPDVAAPGASVVSTLVGSGWKGTTLSGTSMAAPMTAGAAALVVQAHPGWSPLKVKAALVNTADAATIVSYDPERSGAGLVQADAAVTANVVATTSNGTASLNYGYVRARGAWSAARTITLWNDGTRPATYNVAASTSLVTVTPSSITIPAGGRASVTATARLSAAAVKRLPTVDQFLTGDFTGLNTMDGAVTATPTGSVRGQHRLRIPYLLVPRGVSNVVAEAGPRWVRASGILSGRLRLENRFGHSGFADVYALGMTDRAGDGDNGMDVRAAGVSVVAAEDWGINDPAERGVTFAITMHDRFSSAAPHEIDIAIDTDLDGDVDRYVIAFDLGFLESGAWSGEIVSLVTDSDFRIIRIWNANAPLNGSTVLLPALAGRDLGLAAGAGSFRYQVAAWDGFTGLPDITKHSQAFDAFRPAISTGNFTKVAVRSSAKVPAWYRRSAQPRGWLVITLDDRNGAFQGDIVRVPR